MGSSKKHKDRDREHKKKKKHRSRSRSRSKERKHKRDHDEKRKHRKEKKHSVSPEDFEMPEDVRVKDETSTPAGNAAISAPSGDGSTLSIEGTNRIRAKLGLKPLDVGGAKVKDENDEDDEEKKKKEDVHVPAVNITQVKKTEKLKERLANQKERRAIHSKLSKVKTLGDSDSGDESASLWVKKSRKAQTEKDMAMKRAKMLEEMDEEFGIGSLVEEEFGAKKGKEKKYSSRDLAGLTVDHDLGNFNEGKTVILTLKDKGVLEEDDDTLVNVNMVDDEIAEKNTEKKKKKPQYNPHDEPEFDEYGFLKDKELLKKYDDEKERSFKLGSGGKYNAEQERRMKEYKAALQNTGETLSLPPPNIASAYFTDKEMASFKKVNRKAKKIRKRPKSFRADDLVPVESSGLRDLGSRSRKRRGDAMDARQAAEIPGLDLVEDEVEDMETEELDDMEILGPEEDLTGLVVDDDDAGNELEKALNKARKIKQKGKKHMENIVMQSLREIKSGDEEMEEEDVQKPIMLNATSEFCRTLGDIPTYGLAGNRQEDEDELLDFEQELQEERRRQQEEEEAGGTGWQSVEVDNRPVDIQEEEKGPLEEEPVVAAGIAGALLLARRKGLLLEEDPKRSTGPQEASFIQAQHYSIEDKRYDDIDEKYRKRDRFSGGITQDFRDLTEYKPDVKLEYVDETGRNLTPKEAFRQLSHRFHGKGSGKKKTEKRAKQHEQEQLLKSASSSDTPLGTVEMMRTKQKAEKSPYVLLSGGAQKTLLGNTISK